MVDTIDNAIALAKKNHYSLHIAVSYTHLDVYKRQAIDIVKSGTRREDLLLDEDEQAAVDNTVSYTHLDVYKRQTLHYMLRKIRYHMCVWIWVSLF